MKAFANGGRSILWMASISVVILFAAVPVTAGEKVALEGMIKGVACTHYKTECKNTDRAIEMEPDFIFVLSDGTYYFIPNVPRTTKARHAYQKITLYGVLNNQELWVDELVVNGQTKEKKKGKKSKRSSDWADEPIFWKSK